MVLVKKSGKGGTFLRPPTPLVFYNCLEFNGDVAADGGYFAFASNRGTGNFHSSAYAVRNENLIRKNRPLHRATGGLNLDCAAVAFIQHNTTADTFDI